MINLCCDIQFIFLCCDLYLYKKKIMKKVIIISIITLLIQSCSNFNFNRQKFTKLKTRSIKTVESKENDKVLNDVYSNNFLKEVDSNFQHVNCVKKDSTIIGHGIGLNQNSVNNSMIEEVNLFKSNNKKSIINIELENEKKKNSVSLIAKTKVNGLWFFLLLGFPLVLIKNRGFKIATWGKNNVKKAQVLIGIFSITGLASSFFLGNIFDFHITNIMLVAPVAFGLGSLIVNKIKTKKSFIKNKAAVSMLSISSLFLVFSTGNRASFQLLEATSETAVHPALAIFLTLIIIALLLVSIYGVVMLACSLSCAGSEVLAAIVLFGGVSILLFLAILAIYHLFKKKKKLESKKDKSHTKMDVNTVLLIIIASLLMLVIIL